MINLIIQIIIVLLVCGFLWWAFTAILAVMPIGEPFRTIINVLLMILVFAIVLFYAIIPILNSLGHLSLVRAG